MPEGTSVAEFSTTETETGYVFAKNGQRGLNFDWTEFGDTDLMWMRLEIPYPPTGGPTTNVGSRVSSVPRGVV